MLPQSERSLPELLGALTQDVVTLVRQEMRLAKAEVSLKAAHIGKLAGTLAVGALVAYAGALVVLSALVLLLAQFVPYWIAALLLGATLSLVGGVVASRALNALRSANLVPQQTMQSLQEIGNG